MKVLRDVFMAGLISLAIISGLLVLVLAEFYIMFALSSIPGAVYVATFVFAWFMISLVVYSFVD